MKSIIAILFCFAFSLCTFGCQDKSANSSNNKLLTKKAIVQDTVKALVLPILSKEIFDKIMLESNSMDIIPYVSNITLSVNDNASIQKFVLRYASNKVVVNGLTCKKPEGRFIILDKKANYLIQADIYYNAQCQYLVFFEGNNEKPSFATQLSPAGKDYFSRVFSKNAAEELQKLQTK